MICKKCLCNYELDDFDPNLEIPKIMKEKGFCFNCAYWAYRYKNLYNLSDFSMLSDLGYVETKLAKLCLGDTLQVVDNNFELITLHIDKPAPINLDQQPVYRVRGKEGTYLFNVKRVTFQGKISLKERFIPNAICLDNNVALELIDRQSTKIINHLYYKL